MQEELIKLALVNEFTFFRKVLTNYLSEQENMQVVIQATDALDLLNKLKYFPVDILLSDIPVHKCTMNDTLKVIQSQYPKIKIIILSACTDLDVIGDLLDLGIHGYISTEDEPEELLRAIVAVSGDKIYRNKLFTEALYANKQNSIKTNTNGHSTTLDEREKKILQLLWEEKSNKEIADQLFLSIRSIEKIRQDMKEKLGLTSTIGLLKYGITKKIIDNVNFTA